MPVDVRHHSSVYYINAACCTKASGMLYAFPILNIPPKPRHHMPGRVLCNNVLIQGSMGRYLVDNSASGSVALSDGNGGNTALATHDRGKLLAADGFAHL